jgi:primosomal protein N' (replication factor Y)
MPNTIARVIVDIAADREFDYSIPPELLGRVGLGSKVIVSFGRRRTEGFVVGLSGASRVGTVKPLLGLAGGKALLSQPLIDLARWVADYYCAPFELAVRALMPGAVRRSGDSFKHNRFVEPVPAAVAALDREALRRRAPQQAAALDVLDKEPGLFLRDFLERHGLPASAIAALAGKGLVTVRDAAVARNPMANRTFLKTLPQTLMEQQASALALIKGSIDRRDPPVVLLHGVTGSGKTEVYLQAIAHTIAAGKGAIVLVPEISLTPQTVERFKGRFGETVAVLHSSLSEGERHDEWHRIHSGEARIAVGARSAVFAPVANLGLIVVDEEHEPNYKQDEAPRYHARDVAVMRGRLETCAVVLGSATPAFESFYNAQRGKYALADMPARVDHRKMPMIRVVDMRVEAGRSGGGPGIFSRELADLIRLRLENGEQTILFLNRRGFSTSLLCPKCGYVASCDWCSVAYTYHRAEERLKCHICGAVKPVPAACPGCQDPAFKYSGTGTQRLESVVARLFPKARVSRMDADTTAAKNSHWELLGEFKSGKVDILIGTQMIAKGLDIPNVTLIGVVNADTGLHAPDFRAGEHTFQLLTQVAGRAGRGELAGDVVIQTYTPFHPTIQAVRRLDYRTFYDQESETRRELAYPPFGRMVCVTFRGPSDERVAFSADLLAKTMEKALPPGAILSGPSPAPLARAKGLYRHQILIRGPSIRAMSTPLRRLLAETSWPPDVSWVLDVDPVSLI